MGGLNRYIFKKAAISIGGLIIFACCVLLMERLLRIFDVVTNSTNPASDASEMIFSLLPYYLGIAVPLALLLGTIITVDRFSRSSELTAALGAGVSLFHMTKPFLLIAAVLACFTMVIEGYLQPVGRYNYRQVENHIKQTAFTAALREGTFTAVGDRTFFAGTGLPGAGIGPIFIYEKIMDEDTEGGDMNQTGFRVTTAGKGELIIREENGDSSPVLQLEEGRGFQVENNQQLGGELSFLKSSIAGAATVTTFRMRGMMNAK
ncbi:LptF/LptG family permease [Litorimonas sp. RW-G-Af-16]|uniref:LptF/LptG family permease n=1 Tax=Litorimonas sp. RW-G-Af-16 TaxID=3241168 RepID=UPI003AAE2E2E